jgi:hypothetical protein
MGYCVAGFDWCGAWVRIMCRNLHFPWGTIRPVVRGNQSVYQLFTSRTILRWIGSCRALNKLFGLVSKFSLSGDSRAD